MVDPIHTKMPYLFCTVCLYTVTLKGHIMTFTPLYYRIYAYVVFLWCLNSGTLEIQVTQYSKIELNEFNILYSFILDILEC